MRKLIIIAIIWLIALILVAVVMRTRNEAPEPKPTDNTPAQVEKERPEPEVDVTEPGELGVDGQPLDSDPIEYVPDTTIPDYEDVNISRDTVDWADLGKVNTVAKEVSVAFAQYDPRNNNKDVSAHLSGAAKTTWSQLDSNVGDYQNRPVPTARLVSINAADEGGDRIVYATLRIKAGDSTRDDLVTMTFAPRKSVVTRIVIGAAY